MDAPATATEVGRIVIVRRMTAEDDRVEVDECFGSDGMPLALTDAIGMLRQAEDELLSSHFRQSLEQVRAMMLGDVTDKWEAERDAAIITFITEVLNASPKAA